MLAIETADPTDGSPDTGRAGQLLEECKERGLLIGKGGLYGNVLRIAPPLSVTEEEIDSAAEIITAAVSAID